MNQKVCSWSGDATVPLRGYLAVGIQDEPKSLTIIVRYVERGNPVFPLLLIGAGETARHTVGSAGVRSWKKRMPSCNGADTG